MEVIQMGWTSREHTNISEYLTNEIFSKVRKYISSGTGFFSSGSTRLVHYGEKFSHLATLVDLAKFDIDDIGYLSSVEPDILLFQANKFVVSENGTLFAGFPDLIVEVWSKSNTKEERDWKKMLYSSSPITEHWYLQQNSRVVERWIGNSQLSNLYVDEKMVTNNGLILDISDIPMQFFD
ncbi:MAG: Uma2 family endonuclease [Firmicutes bacterium]|nr:Uma2 family endonuclease [Bacillota bacterium]